MSDLAALYSSEGSILERHHLAQTLCILNIHKCAILKNLSREDYSNAIDLIQHLILITDIANHCKGMGKMNEIVSCYDSSNESHQKYLLGLMMTCSDLNQVTKPISVSVDISNLIYQEFHTQGEKEKQRGHTPIPMMDKEKSNIPTEQIGFINHLAMPAFALLSKFVPETQVNVDTISKLLAYWESKK